MGKIFKNMIPYWKMIICVLVFLVIQAFCDLSLPSYTSDIIDVGIQNKGVEHILPERITAKEYEKVKLFMNDKEKAKWEACYEKASENVYERVEDDEDKLNKLDDELATAIFISYSMSSIDEDTFKEQMAEQSNQDASAFDNISIEDIGKMLGVDIQVTEKSGKKYVDMRDILVAMVEGQKMTEEQLTKLGDDMSEKFEKVGDTVTKSMGIAFAIKCDEETGIDIDKIQTNYLWTAGFKMLGVALIMGIATVVVGFFASKIGAGIGRDLRKKIFTKVVGFSNTEMDKFSTASLITRSTNDIQQIQMVSTMLLRMVFYAPIIGIGGVIKVMNTRSGMGWIIVAAVAVLLMYVGILMMVSLPKFKLMQVMVDKVNLVSREILTGLSVIRAFGREKKEEERFDDANRNLTKTMLFTNRVMTFMMPGMMLIMNGLSVLIVWVASHKIDAGTIQVGAMTAFITYAMIIVMSFLMLTMMSIMLPRAGVAAERIDEVINTDSSIMDKENPETLPRHDGVIVFEHVNFRYPGANEDVLSDIDFVAEPGKTTAIIGSTGCGKSTLVNLIPRLYDVTEGRILFDGKDIRDISMKELRDEIGYVPQKGILFSGTIASNLRFGNKDASDEEIIKAAEIAQATEFINEKSDKYDSAIAQGGSNVSGGQKQRLSIARAIAKNPKVFIFDDSFSALDMKTDAVLRKALSENVKDSTVIIVAQRISTIINADQILVIDDGKIVGKGTHKELLANCEVYQQIATSQLSEKELGMAQGKEE